MKNKIKKIRNVFIGLFDFFIPKKENKIVFACENVNDWNGNCAFLFQYILQVKDDKTEVIIVTEDIRFQTVFNLGSIVRNSRTISGLYALLTSGVIVHHHGVLSCGIPLLSKRRVNFHINHGIHYKKVEYSLDPNCYEFQQGSKFRTRWICNHHAVSSHVDALSCCADYLERLNNISITGIPRNDLFFYEDENYVPKNVIDDIEKLKERVDGRSVVSYAPTWRNSGGAYVFSEEEVLKIEQVLERYNAVFVYAGHPYLKERTVPLSNRFIDYNNEFSDIQSLLLLTDVLITDYSSVWIDYLLTRRPMISFQFDKDTYQDDRGFLFNTDKIFPGDVVYKLDSLIDSLHLALANKTPSGNYESAITMFHEFEDGGNSKRVYESIKKLVSMNS